MTLASWTAEFYPTPASDFLDNEDASWADAARHSLIKWRGALPENVAKHGLTMGLGFISDARLPTPEVFIFGEDECSLCAKSTDTKFNDRDCKPCPLYKVRGAVCTESRDVDGELELAPYDSAFRGKPAALIRHLEEALALAERKQDDAADAAYNGKMLDGAADDDERNDILRQASQ